MQASEERVGCGNDPDRWKPITDRLQANPTLSGQKTALWLFRVECNNVVNVIDLHL